MGNTKANFETGILATVFVQSWKTVWAKSFIFAIVEAYIDSSMLRVFAVKGGVETDMEIRLIEEVMPLLGFEVVTFRNERSGRIFWEWHIERRGGETLMVILSQGATIQSFRSETLVAAMYPN